VRRNRRRARPFDVPLSQPGCATRIPAFRLSRAREVDRLQRGQLTDGVCAHTFADDGKIPNIARVPLPAADPVFGGGGLLLSRWR